MIFLVQLKYGYDELYFKFESLDKMFDFVTRVKFSFVDVLSDYNVTSIKIEVLTEDEYKEKIEKAKGE